MNTLREAVGEYLDMRREYVFSALGSGAARASWAMKLVARWAQVAASEARICQVRAPFWVLLPHEILRAITAGGSWRSARLLVASTPS
jgi:hypothetical protein